MLILVYNCWYMFIVFNTGKMFIVSNTCSLLLIFYRYLLSCKIALNECVSVKKLDKWKYVLFLRKSFYTEMLANFLVLICLDLVEFQCVQTILASSMTETTVITPWLIIIYSIFTATRARIAILVTVTIAVADNINDCINIKVFDNINCSDNVNDW